MPHSPYQGKFGPIPTKLGYIVVFLMVCTLVGCRADRQARSDRFSDAASFAPFASEVYAQLSQRTLGDGLQTDVGLFGDLDVMAGDEVVMGRYRFRVDTMTTPSTAYMAFHVRGADGVLTPVRLQFASAADGWHLEEEEHQLYGGASDTAREVPTEALEAWITESVAAAARAR